MVARGTFFHKAKKRQRPRVIWTVRSSCINLYLMAEGSAAPD